MTKILTHKELYCPKCGSLSVCIEDITEKEKVSMDAYDPFGYDAFTVSSKPTVYRLICLKCNYTVDKVKPQFNLTIVQTPCQNKDSWKKEWENGNQSWGTDPE